MYFCYNIRICHKHTNQTRGKEPKHTVFWSDLEPKMGRRYLLAEEEKVEQNSLFNMLPKKNRCNKKLIDEIFKSGRFINSANLTFKFVEICGNKGFFVRKKESSCSLQKPLLTQISFIAPKSVAKLAVKRNLLRRRGYVALEKYMGQFPVGLCGVFIFKRTVDSVSKIEDEIKTILHHIN